MINYLPPFLRDFEEYKAIFKSVEPEIQTLKDRMVFLIKQASIVNATEAQVIEWEDFLNIVPEGNLYQRKKYITGVLNATGKLNERKIKEIVSAYSDGAKCEVLFEDSTLKVRVVKVGEEGEIFLFPDIKRTLEVVKPAHIKLLVEKYYSIIQDVEDKFNTIGEIETTFATIKDFEDWAEVE